jgi:polar amino acid transport system substrate-binding protein
MTPRGCGRLVAAARHAPRLARVLTVCSCFACFVCLALGARPAPADTLAHVRARGEIVWGGDLQGGEPYVFEARDEAGAIAGFEVDIAAALARRLGVERARFQQLQWSSLVPALERGDVDIALNGLEDTPERRARLLLSRPYFVFHETLAVRRGSPIHAVGDLPGRRVATMNQTYALAVLRGLSVEPVLYEGQQEPYMDLALGRVDAVLLDDVIAERYGCATKGVACLPGSVADGTYVIGMRQGDERLKGAIDGALAGMLATGELRRILEKWRLWDEQQDALATAARTPTASAVTTASAPTTASMTATTTATKAATARGLDAGQLVLFLRGAGVTLVISFAAFAIAMPLGMALAAVRIGRARIARVAAASYVEVFRGTPVLLQLYVLYFGLAPLLKLDAMTAAILGLGLNYAAYEAEVYRGAMLAVPRGQLEAAAAMGLAPLQTLRYVLLPQAMRAALPAVTNDFVSLLKDSSLVSVLTVVELTKRMTIAAVETRSWIVPGLLCAALYFGMSLPLSRLSRRLEARLANDPHPRIV